MPNRLLRHDILARAEALGLAVTQIVEGLRVGDHSSPFRGFSAEFVQHREYVPGDDTRHIDWKSYARSDRYSIKQYEQETNLIAHIVLDVSNSMRYGSGSQSKHEYAKLLAASLAYVIVKQGDSVALRFYADDWKAEIPSGSHSAQVRLICEALESTPPGNTTRTGQLLVQLASVIKRRGLIFVLSDGFDQPKGILEGLQQLRYPGHEVVFFQILHADELDFPFTGSLRFSNLEGHDRVLVRPQQIRSRYLEAMSAFRNQLQGSCERMGVSYRLMRTDRDLKVALLEYLMSRRKSIRPMR
jgi:uncharacterized protein (DUF58 family)